MFIAEAFFIEFVSDFLIVFVCFISNFPASTGVEVFINSVFGSLPV